MWHKHKGNYQPVSLTSSSFYNLWQLRLHSGRGSHLSFLFCFFFSTWIWSRWRHNERGPVIWFIVSSVVAVATQVPVFSPLKTFQLPIASASASEHIQYISANAERPLTLSYTRARTHTHTHRHKRQESRAQQISQGPDACATHFIWHTHRGACTQSAALKYELNLSPSNNRRKTSQHCHRNGTCSVPRPARLHMDNELWLRRKRRQIQPARAVMESDNSSATPSHPSNLHFRSVSGTVEATCGHLAPQSEVLLISGYFLLCLCAEVSFRSHLLRRLSSASAQQSASNGAMIHTWRIELSEVDRMCNLHEWAKLTWSVSVRNERLSGFMTDSLSERKGGPPGV